MDTLPCVVIVIVFLLWLDVHDILCNLLGVPNPLDQEGQRHRILIPVDLARVFLSTFRGYGPIDRRDLKTPPPTVLLVALSLLNRIVAILHESSLHRPDSRTTLAQNPIPR